jgi:hypothetical protein
VPQEVANELGNFNIRRFMLAAVGWFVDNNHPLSEFEKPAFRDRIAMVNPEAEAALWQSHKSVCQYVMRLYNHLQHWQFQVKQYPVLFKPINGLTHPTCHV